MVINDLQINHIIVLCFPPFIYIDFFMQILILGMHRSGTSATARLVNMMGCYFAPEGMALPAKPDNPTGFWERRDILQLNDALLKQHGCAWNRLKHWSYDKASLAPDELMQSMRAIIGSMDAHQPWFIKDPRLCLLLPAWMPLLSSPVAVIVYRHPHEIALSLKNRGQGPVEHSIALWEAYAVGLLNATRALSRIHVSHSALLSKPFKTCEAMFEQLGAAGVDKLALPSAQEVRSFINPDLYRAKSLPQGMPPLSAHQQQLCDMLQGNIPQQAAVTLSEASRAQLDNAT